MKLTIIKFFNNFSFLECGVLISIITSFLYLLGYLHLIGYFIRFRVLIFVTDLPFSEIILIGFLYLISIIIIVIVFSPVLSLIKKINFFNKIINYFKVFFLNRSYYLCFIFFIFICLFAFFGGKFSSNYERSYNIISKIYKVEMIYNTPLINYSQYESNDNENNSISSEIVKEEEYSFVDKFGKQRFENDFYLFFENKNNYYVLPYDLCRLSASLKFRGNIYNKDDEKLNDFIDGKVSSVEITQDGQEHEILDMFNVSICNMIVVPRVYVESLRSF